VRALLFAAALLPAPTVAQDMSGMQMPMSSAPSSAPAKAGAQATGDSAAAQSPSENMPGMDMGQMTMGTTTYGAGSGTARVPANEGTMSGLHVMTGGWMLMAHGYVWGNYTDQGGPRGGNEAFVTSMAMLEGMHDLSETAHLQLRSMFSLEPAMGQEGYPNLFASGETAHGLPLIDRQHPHDLFMELSARLDFDVAPGTSLFVYGGPVAEPALGPSAFMHRASAQYEPLSPISHHWFDSTHITYGVVTGGISTAHWQFEGSAFRGREPDENRWDIETPKLDSWSVRASWTPSPDWALQVSHGFLHSPEVLEPQGNERRTTATVQYDHGGLSTTFGWALKDKSPGRALSAFLAEANYDLTRHHTVFGRIENVANDELFPDLLSPLHDQKFRVTRFEGGYVYRMPLVGPLELALGGSLAAYAKPAALDAAYGDAPVSYTLFAKLSLGH
jgi:hypothetical protein